MKQFLPFLTDDVGRSLAVEDEVVVTRSIPDPLENSPDGWEKNTIQAARNNEFRSVIKFYTTSLKFYLQGAKILRDAFYRKGMETVLYFIWLKQNTAFGAGMKYEGWYKGEPDLGTFKDEYDGVEVSITEGGFYKDLQANKAITQEIPFDKDAVMLYNDGLNLNETLNYEIPEGFVTGPDYSYIIMPFTFLNNEGASSGITFYSQIGEEVGSVPNYSTEQKFFLSTVGNITIRFKGSIKFRIEGAGFITSKFYLHTQTREFMISDNHDYTEGTYEIPFDFVWAILPGEHIFLMSDAPSSSLSAFIFILQSDVKITYITRSVGTVNPAFRVFDLGNKLTGRVSANTALTSPLLEPDFNLLVTSGDALRNIVGAKIKTTFSDWHKSVDAVKCVALEIINNNPVLSSRYDKFNKNSSIAQLGECSKWTMEPADDYIYDSVEVGYPSKSSQSNDDVNGKYSFNNTYLWKLNVTRRKVNAYQAKSVYYADPYDIELIRVNFNQKDTTTANTDNSNFFIDAQPKTDISFSGTIHFYHSDNRIEINGDTTVIDKFIVPGMKINISGTVSNNGIYTIVEIIDRTAFTDIVFSVLELVAVTEDAAGVVTLLNLYELRRLPYTSITGIPNDGTIYNIELSVRRILENHLRWLRSSFDHLDMFKLIMQTTEKNADLVTTDALGNVISEKADILVSAMGERVYLPYYVSFEIASPYNLKELIDSNNSGKLDYKMSGIDMDGFIIDVKSEPATLETQTYKLLQSANNDNTQLINNR